MKLYAHRIEQLNAILIKVFRFITVIALCLAMEAKGIPRHHELSFSEAEPLLVVISKLSHVTVVQASPYLQMEYPSICWIDEVPFKRLSEPLNRYQGSLKWSTFVDLPRRCLFVQPDVMKGESPFVAYGPLDESELRSARLEATKLADRLQQFGIPTPWRSSPWTDGAEFKKRVLTEIPRLAAFLESDLSLRDKTSLGVDLSSETLELAGVEDRAGPGESVLIVADPFRYARERAATSKYDRSIHFWITDQEFDDLSEDLSTANGGSGTESSSTSPALSKILSTRFEGVAISPWDISTLESDVNKLKARTHRRNLIPALDRILSVCRSARAYGLGIFIPSRTG